MPLHPRHFCMALHTDGVGPSSCPWTWHSLLENQCSQGLIGGKDAGHPRSEHDGLHYRHARSLDLTVSSHSGSSPHRERRSKLILEPCCWCCNSSMDAHIHLELCARCR